MIQEFQAGRDPETSVTVVKNMVSTIDTMIRIFQQKSLLIDDLQWIVSPQDLSIRIVDPIGMVYLDIPNRKYGQNPRQIDTRHLFGRVYHQFLKQQSDLVAIRDAVCKTIGLESQQQQRHPRPKKRPRQIEVQTKDAKEPSKRKRPTIKKKPPRHDVA
jgi:hypothetical protein